MQVTVPCFLFYAPVSVGCKMALREILHLRSMSCMISEVAESKLRDVGPPVCLMMWGWLIMVVSLQNQCVFMYSLLYRSFVSGQRDNLIIGSNVIRSVIQKLKSDDSC